MKHLKQYFLTSVFLLYSTFNLLSANVDLVQTNLIPQPVKISYHGGNLLLPSQLALSNTMPEKASHLLAASLVNDLNILVSVDDNANSFVCYEHDQTLKAEAYRLDVDSAKITIYASTELGALWATQSLRQLLKQASLLNAGVDKLLPLVNIADEPRHAWRGFHMDVSRHFFTTDYVKKTIEQLSFYKINKLHLHLSDDNGWRIEIDKYPLLTQIGSWRTSDAHDSACIPQSVYNGDMRIDNRFVRDDSMYGGFYTKSEMRDIILHAEQLGIEIIPEIDMPGHMSAAIRAYPFLSCQGDAGWGSEFSHPICPCNPGVMSFAKDVYSEIADLFPSQYVHIGADEVEKDTWEASSDCKKMMKKHKMKSSTEIQTYFVNEIQQFLESKGKKVITWDDAAEGDVNSSLTMMYWRDWKKDAPNKIRERGNPIIFTAWTPFYLSNNPTLERLKQLYEFDIQSEYDGINSSQIMGYQACVWTEHIPSEAKFEQHIYPALQAFCELNWGTIGAWDDFTKRLSLHQRMMDKERIGYNTYNY